MKLSHSIVQADAVEFLRAQPPDSLDLVFGSPPYEQARLYLEGGVNMGISRKTDAWVAWMLEVYKAASVACRGLVAFVVAGQTRKYRWSAGPALLMAELHRAGLNLRNPPIFSRVGIPGSGGPDWLRGDAELIVCTSRPGRLPWSNNTACGHPPKWAPGGAMAHRLTNGQRVNQWGKTGTESVNGHAARNADGRRQKAKRPSHKMGTKKGIGRATRGSSNGDIQTMAGYDPPALANPGNLIQYTPSETEIISFLMEYANASGKHPDEIVRSLQEAVRTKTVALWCLGAATQIQGAAFLQSSLHGERQSNAAGQGAEDCQGEIPGSAIISNENLPKVRGKNKSHSSSCGREPDEQSSGERRNTLPGLPCGSSQSAAESHLPSLREAEPFIGFVRGSLLPLQAAWRSAEEMSQQSLWYRGASSSLIKCLVGGGVMGSRLAHLNEAPFPESLASFFVLSFCPPGGIVCDPFSGSGTTAAVSKRHGRNFAGCDLRQSQVELGLKRLASETTELFAGVTA